MMANTGNREQFHFYDDTDVDDRSKYGSNDFRVLLSRYAGYGALFTALFVLSYAAIELFF